HIMQLTGAPEEIRTPAPQICSLLMVCRVGAIWCICLPRRACSDSVPPFPCDPLLLSLLLVALVPLDLDALLFAFYVIPKNTDDGRQLGTLCLLFLVEGSAVGLKLLFRVAVVALFFECLQALRDVGDREPGTGHAVEELPQVLDRYPAAYR